MDSRTSRRKFLTGLFAGLRVVARVLAIAIGVCGVLVTALVAAIAVKALTAASDGD